MGTPNQSLDKRPDTTPPKVGLVLGAGGLVGQAYHSGVLAALEVDLGWDPRTADVIVGTSAGALSAALLRMGTSTLDLASWSLGRNWDTSFVVLEELDRLRKRLPRLSLRNLLGRWRLPARHSVGPCFRRPSSVQLLPMVASVLPPGRTSLVELMEESQIGWSRSWPEHLWICATRCDNGQRMAFGHDPSPSVPLVLAVAASSAVPSHFSPVTIEGVKYIDGGMYSPTNADLFADEDLDLVIIVSPMSGGAGPADAAIRAMARRRLREEMRLLQRVGTTIVCFEPHHDTARLMGFNPMDQHRVASVLKAAFFEAGAAVADVSTQRTLATLGRGRDRVQAA